MYIFLISLSLLLFITYFEFDTIAPIVVHQKELSDMEKQKIQKSVNNGKTLEEEIQLYKNQYL